MTLAEYRRKRHFDKTREPEPGTRAAGDPVAGQIFVVQLHHASSRHYDFRLQVGEALKSWAVPKGPSFDPKVKRLAAEVEDHPLAYASFEGDIPAGQYGAGHVDIFDGGVWTTDGDPQAQLDKGHLKFQLFGERLKGGWHLVRSRRSSRQPQWLLFKQRDEHAAPDLEADDLLDAGGSGKGRSNGQSQPGGKTGAPSTAAEQRKAKPQSGSKAAGRRRSQPVGWQAAAADLSGARAAKLQPESVELQLARLVDEPPTGDDWLHEPKWDGYRILALVDKGDVTLWSRNHLAWTHKLPAIAAALRDLGLQHAALDGELIAGNGTRKDFGLLQATLSGERKGTLTYMLFDILHVDGVDLTAVPLIDRKQLLERILANAPRPLAYSTHIAGNGHEVFAAAAAHGLEGIVSKRAGAPHRAGRSDDWRKSKELTSDEFAVVGFTPPKGARAGFGALLLARPDPAHGWRYTGRLGTGFSNNQLTELLKQIDRDTRATPTVHVPPHDTDLRGARWIEPSVVVEAFYRGVGKEGLLRQPSLKAIRPDKEIADLLDPDRPRAPAADEAPAPPQSRASSKSQAPSKSRASSHSTAPAAAKAQSAKKSAAAKAPAAAPGDSPPSGDEFGMRLTHPERVVFPDSGKTKGDVARYYIAIMPWLLPEIVNRPLSIIRCTDGIDKACFFQKHATAGLSQVDTVPILEESGKYADYLVVNNAESLMELVQFNALEFHPWGSHADRPEVADRIVFDLDPAPEVPFKDLVAAAREIRRLLQELSLVSFVRASGGKGLHVVVPLNPGCDWSVVKPFARAFAESLAARAPTRYIATASKAQRKGRIFIDYLRNGRGATSVASWSLRSRPGAPVAVPLAWEELGRLKRADTFTIDSVPQRLATLAADPWEGIDEVEQDLDAVAQLLQEHGG